MSANLIHGTICNYFFYTVSDIPIVHGHCFILWKFISVVSHCPQEHFTYKTAANNYSKSYETREIWKYPNVIQQVR